MNELLYGVAMGVGVWAVLLKLNIHNKLHKYYGGLSLDSLIDIVLLIIVSAWLGGAQAGREQAIVAGLTVSVLLTVTKHIYLLSRGRLKP